MFVRTITLVVAALSLSAGLLAADDPFMGTWKQNASKSPQMAPDRQRNVVRKYEPIPNGLKLSWEAIDDKGEVTRWVVEVKFDGKDYPVVGNAGFDTLALKRVDQYTIEGTSKKDGLVAVELRWVVSKDGKTMTRTEKRFRPVERAGTTSEVYEKQ